MNTLFAVLGIVIGMTLPQDNCNAPITVPQLETPQCEFAYDVECVQNTQEYLNINAATALATANAKLDTAVAKWTKDMDLANKAYWDTVAVCADAYLPDYPEQYEQCKQLATQTLDAKIIAINFALCRRRDKIETEFMKDIDTYLDVAKLVMSMCCVWPEFGVVAESVDASDLKSDGQ